MTLLADDLWHSIRKDMNSPNRDRDRIALATMGEDKFMAASGDAGEDRDLRGKAEPFNAPTERASVRSDFRMTALFVGRLLVDSSGRARLQYKLPANIGTFNIRVFAAKGLSAFGVAETSQVVRRPVSMYASVPRMVRLHDEFECGVVVSAYPSLKTAATGSVDVTVRVEHDRGLALALQDEQKAPPRCLSASVSFSAPREFRFAFRAARLNLTTLRFFAYVGAVTGCQTELTSDWPLESDALETRIAVLQQQNSVFLATSMELAAQSDSPVFWKEGLFVHVKESQRAFVRIATSRSRGQFRLSRCFCWHWAFSSRRIAAASFDSPGRELHLVLGLRGRRRRDGARRLSGLYVWLTLVCSCAFDQRDCAVVKQRHARLQRTHGRCFSGTAVARDYNNVPGAENVSGAVVF